MRRAASLFRLGSRWQRRSHLPLLWRIPPSTPATASCCRCHRFFASTLVADSSLDPPSNNNVIKKKTKKKGRGGHKAKKSPASRRHFRLHSLYDKDQVADWYEHTLTALVPAKDWKWMSSLETVLWTTSNNSKDVWLKVEEFLADRPNHAPVSIMAQAFWEKVLFHDGDNNNNNKAVEKEVDPAWVSRLSMARLKAIHNWSTGKDNRIWMWSRPWRVQYFKQVQEQEPQQQQQEKQQPVKKAAKNAYKKHLFDVRQKQYQARLQAVVQAHESKSEQEQRKEVQDFVDFLASRLPPELCKKLVLLLEEILMGNTDDDDTKSSPEEKNGKGKKYIFIVKLLDKILGSYTPKVAVEVAQFLYLDISEPRETKDAPIAAVQIHDIETDPAILRAQEKWDEEKLKFVSAFMAVQYKLVAQQEETSSSCNESSEHEEEDDDDENEMITREEAMADYLPELGAFRAQGKQQHIYIFPSNTTCVFVE